MSQFKQKTKEQLMETWGDLLTAEGLPKIDESRHVVMAKIFENQEADFATGTEYRDPEIVKAFEKKWQIIPYAAGSGLMVYKMLEACEPYKFFWQ